MSKVSAYSENTNPATGDFALGETASGPTTNRFKFLNLIKLFFANSPSLQAETQTVANNEGTNSASYTDLATTTDEVTVTIGASGMALVDWGAEVFQPSGSGAFGYISFVASGANTIAAGTYEVFSKSAAANSEVPSYRSKLITGLTPGSTTFKLKYHSTGGTTVNFYQRDIEVVPL